MQGKQRQMRSLMRAIWPGSGAEVPSVLVLTPVKNASKHLPGYVDRIGSLQWPRNRLRLGMLESDSEDGTCDASHAPNRQCRVPRSLASRRGGGQPRSACRNGTRRRGLAVPTVAGHRPAWSAAAVSARSNPPTGRVADRLRRLRSSRGVRAKGLPRAPGEDARQRRRWSDRRRRKAH